jgi:hypothetical protein
MVMQTSEDDLPICRGKFSLFKNGIVNHGLSCYINVVLQSLLRCPGIREYFFYNLHLKDISGPRDLSGSLSEKLAEFVKIYFAFNEKILDPFELRTSIGKLNKMFDSNTQEDAHEFFIFLLDILNFELRRAKPPTNLQLAQKSQSRKKEEKVDPVDLLPFEEKSCTFWAQELVRNNSIFQDAFLGQYVSKVTCKECSFKSTSFQAFNILEVPVPSKQETTLRDCFSLFTQQETLECGLWRCPKCQKKVQASKHINLSVLPPVLVICLKRFGVKDGAAYKSNCLVRTDLDGEDLAHLMDPDSPSRESTVYLPFAFVVALDEPASQRQPARRPLHLQHPKMFRLTAARPQMDHSRRPPTERDSQREELNGTLDSPVQLSPELPHLLATATPVLGQVVGQPQKLALQQRRRGQSHQPAARPPHGADIQAALFRQDLARLASWTPSPHRPAPRSRSSKQAED